MTGINLRMQQSKVVNWTLPVMCYTVIRTIFATCENRWKSRRRELRLSGPSDRKLAPPP